MTEFEINVLRELNGEKVEGLCWGAAMSEAIEWLLNNGYVHRRAGEKGSLDYFISPKGEEYLAGL